MARTYVERIAREKKLAQVDALNPITLVVTHGSKPSCTSDGP